MGWEPQSESGRGKQGNAGLSSSALAKARFDGRWIAWTQDGVERIPAPAWLDWPMVRGDEFAPQSPVTPKAKRR